MSRPKIGLALGGGAARGAAHLGVLRELKAAGIEVDVAAGTSIGSIAAAAYVLDDLDALEQWALGIDLFEMLRNVDASFSGGGLIAGDKIMSRIAGAHRDKTIEELPKPFAAIATELATGREVCFTSGPLMRAVRASIALPGLFAAVEVDGRWLVDGGLVNNVPVTPARDLGADVVIAVNLNTGLVGPRRSRKIMNDDEKAGGSAYGKGRRDFLDKLVANMPEALKSRLPLVGGPETRRGKDGAPGYLDVTIGALNIMQDIICRSRLAGDPPEVLIAPRLAHIDLLDFGRAGDAIEEGAAATRRALPAIEELLG